MVHSFGGNMKYKLILAAITTPLLLGAMQTSAHAACSLTGDSISCGQLSLGTAAQIQKAVSNDSLSIIGAAFTASKAAYLAAFTATYNYNLSHGLPTPTNLSVGAISKTFQAAVSNSDPDVTGLAASGSVLSEVYGKFENNLVTFFTTSIQNTGRLSYTIDGEAVQSTSTGYKNVTVELGTAQFQPVPGPEAGAGLGALTMGGLAVYMKRRRKEVSAAA